jgi:hypothetical protein
MNNVTSDGPTQRATYRDRPASASAAARRVLGLPDPAPRSAARIAVDRAVERVGGPVGLAAATAPTIAFVAADAVAGLQSAFVALGVTALTACAVRLLRRESPGAAVAGLLVAGVCAGVAALAGEARAFFLPTMVVPAMFVLAYLISLAAGRPLMGLMVNPLAGGPRHWRQHPTLRRTYLLSSLIGLTLATANLLARVVFYLADEPTVLAIIQIAATTVFAAHFASTLVAARRVASRSHASPTPLSPAHSQP